MTCTDDQSRNRRFGLALARGLTPEQAQNEINQLIEGIRTVGVVKELARVYNIEMPISEQVFNIIQGTVNVREAVQELLARERKVETD